MSIHDTLKEDLRISLMLEPIETAPAEGWTFSAFLSNGARVTAERHDDRYVVYDRHHPHLYRATVAADEFVGWLPDDGGPYEDPAPYVLSERQERAEYEAEIEDHQRQYEEA
jgi:hypothetical protein